MIKTKRALSLQSRIFIYFWWTIFYPIRKFPALQASRILLRERCKNYHIHMTDKETHIQHTEVRNFNFYKLHIS